MEESSVEVRYIERKGRGLFALKQFEPGDVLFEEIPLVSCQFAWNKDYKYAACEYCMRALETAEENANRLSGNQTVTLPHPELCTVNKSNHVQCIHCGEWYCSPECREAAWKLYHMTLCMRKMTRDVTHPLEILMETWKQIHYPPETASIMLCAKAVATVQQAENRAFALGRYMNFCSESEEQGSHSKMFGVKFSDRIDALRNAFFSAVSMEDCDVWSTPSGFHRLLSTMAMNGQGIGTSSFSEWVKNVTSLKSSTDEGDVIDVFIDQLYEQFDTVVGEFLNNEGAGLYSLQSAINHSCNPNAEITFPYGNHQLAVKALSTIQIGNEICISYLDECTLHRSHHSRQKILRNNYLFTCTCNKCDEEKDDPDVTSEEEPDQEDSMTS